METMSNNLGQLLSRSEVRKVKGSDDGGISFFCRIGSCLWDLHGVNIPGFCVDVSNQCYCRDFINGDQANSDCNL